MTIPETTLSSDNKIPLIGMGTAYPKQTFEPIEVKKALVEAIKLGYRHVDTSPPYKSESLIGEAIADAIKLQIINSRDEMFVTSKLWCSDAHYHLVVPALRNSLKNLRMDYVDLYLIHWPVSAKPGAVSHPIKHEDLLPLDYKSVWKAMEECKKLGLTKSIGVSNFSIKKLQNLLTFAEIPPSVNQVEMSPVWQQKKLRDFCSANCILVIAYAPLGAKGMHWGTNQVMDCQVLKEIALIRDKTVAQVSLRWVYEQGAALIVKSFNKERMKENLSIFDWELTKEDYVKINKIEQHRGMPKSQLVSEIGPFKSLTELWDGGVSDRRSIMSEESDMMEKVMKATNDLYIIRDTYFPLDPNHKFSKLQTHSQFALNLLDSIPSEHRKSATERATYEYLRGKILDVFPEYSKKAEDHLSKAVKLNPSLGDAWLCLGNCIWKKGDLPATRNCFNLALSKGPNKRILSQLSMLERRMAQGADNQEEIVAESIKHAKEAIALDVKDGNSWYNLGNACLTCFFVTGAWDHSKLQQSLKAYQNAEKDESMKSNPDLYFNCATVNTYLENYERALSGFEAAASKDPCLNAAEEVRKMINLFDKIDNLLKGQIKAKQLANLTSSLPATQLNPSYKKATIDSLLDGLNKTIAIVGKVLFFIKYENITPLYYLVCDSNQNCFVLSVYGISNNAIKEGDRITLLDPCFHNNDFSWNEKRYQFKSIRVDFMEQVNVNGKPLPSHHSVRSSIYAQHKP